METAEKDDKNVILPNDTIPLTTLERKRYFQSAKYVLEGSAQQLVKRMQAQNYEKLFDFKVKIPKIDKEEVKEKSKIAALKAAQVGLLVGGLWLLYAGVNKAIDYIPTDITTDIVEQSKKIKGSLTKTLADNFHKIRNKIRGGLGPLEKFLDGVILRMGLVFDQSESYKKIGHMLTDAGQRDRGVIGDTISSLFEAVIWYSMQKMLPDVILNYWNLPLHFRHKSDKGMIDVLWNDDTNYYHDVANPFKRRLGSVTAANKGLNAIQEMSVAGKDFDDILEIKTRGYSGFEDIADEDDENQFTEYFNEVSQDAQRQLRFQQAQYESGEYKLFDKTLFKTTGGLLTYSNVTFHGDADIRNTFSLYKDVDGDGMITRDDEYVRRGLRDKKIWIGEKSAVSMKKMPYSGMEKGIWNVGRGGKLEQLNDLMYQADRIITNYTYETTDPQEQLWMGSIKKWWKQYGAKKTDGAGYSYAYLGNEIFEIVQVMAHLVALESYAALNSTAPALALFDNYMTESPYQDYVKQNEKSLIRGIIKDIKTNNLFTKYHDQYERGDITIRDYIHLVQTEMSNIISDMKSINEWQHTIKNEVLNSVEREGYGSALQFYGGVSVVRKSKWFQDFFNQWNRLIAAYSASLFDKIKLRNIINDLQEINDINLRNSLGRNAVFVSNTSSTYKSFNTKATEFYKNTEDLISNVDGKQVEIVTDEDYDVETVWSDEVSGDNLKLMRLGLLPHFSETTEEKLDERLAKNGIVEGSIYTHDKGVARGSFRIKKIKKYRFNNGLYSYYGEGFRITKKGKKKRVRVKSIRDDGTVWIDDCWEYSIDGSDEKRYELIEGQSKKAESTMAEQHGDNLNSSIVKENFTTKENAFLLTQQYKSFEENLYTMRKKREELLDDIIRHLEDINIGVDGTVLETSKEIDAKFGTYNETRNLYERHEKVLYQGFDETIEENEYLEYSIMPDKQEVTPEENATNFVNKTQQITSKLFGT